MSRRALLVIPPLVAGAAAAGVVSGEHGWLIVVASGLAGLALAFGLSRVDGPAGERARIERLLENLPNPVLLFGAGGLAYANPAAHELFGLSADDEGRDPMAVLGVQGLADAVAEAAETGRTCEVEVERAERHLVGRTSTTSEGEVALVVIDLTDMRRVEAIRRDFVTNASHELKTPVAGIQALSESLALAQERDPERARTMIQRLQREAERLATLVRDLLDLARLEESYAEGRQRVDLAEVVCVQMDRLGPAAQERGVKLLRDCPEPTMVIASPQDLRLIVSNLLENAVQYNRPDGEVRAAVRRAGGCVELEVSDTGVGIPADELDRVFERFYRIDKARSRSAGGTGLGLSIVRNAVARNGGEVSVHSVLGTGTTFHVRMPVEGAGA